MRWAPFVLFVLVACTPLATGTGSNSTVKVQLKDMAYTDKVKTIRLFPGNAAYEPNPAAVTRLNGDRLTLEFDVLSAQPDTYYAYILHCNHDWSLSSLRDLDFLSDYNEFPVIDYSYSIDTQIPYVHYRLVLPAVQLPGNYVVAVYRGTNKDEIMLTRRFMVYANKLVFQRGSNLVGSGYLAQRNQQINFTLGYRDMQLENPMMNIFVVLRQNHRWDNLVTGLKPTFVREDRHELEYRFFDEGGGILSGWNEFRFFDLRSIAFPGQYVDHVNRNAQPFEAYVRADTPRDGRPYSQLHDLNGGFITENLDTPGGPEAGNYAVVHFELDCPRLPRGQVYVEGAFNHWSRDQVNRMRYDSAAGAYKAGILLKQGRYDYLYVVDGGGQPANMLEGSHFETENDYEIFAYYRSYREPADLLLGYFTFTENTR